MRNKNGQIQVCIDFRELNKSYPKNDFLVQHIQLLIDATIGNETLSLMDGYSGYNQIKMHLDAQK